MRKPLFIALLLILALAGGGAAWWTSRPKPPPPAPEERTYEQIDRAEYEAWMRELGYTE